MAKNKPIKVESADPIGEVIELFNRKKINTDKIDRHLGVRYNEFENSIQLAFNTIANSLGKDCDLHGWYGWGYSGELTFMREDDSNITFYFYFKYSQDANIFGSKKQREVNGILNSAHIHVSANNEQSYKSGGSVFNKSFIFKMPKTIAVDIGACLTTDIAELYSEQHEIDTRIKNLTRLVASAKSADMHFIESLITPLVEESYFECLEDLKIYGCDDPEIDLEEAEEFYINFDDTNSNIFRNREGRLCIIFNVVHYTMLGGFDVGLENIDALLIEKWAEYGYSTVIRNEDSPDLDYGCNYSVRFYLDKLDNVEEE